MEKMTFAQPGQWEPSFDFDPVVFGKMKADTYNALEGDLTGYDCPQCRNKGVVAYVRDDGSLYTASCKCATIRHCIWEMERSGLKKSIRELTFESFAAKEPWQQTIKNGAMAYAQAMDGWLLFCGQPGSGKTHLCTAVCRQRLLQGQQVRYMPWREKVAQIKACAFDGVERAKLVDGYKTAEILYIDDLYKTGKGPDGVLMPTASDVAIAFEILNYRYLNKLPTLVSTERTPQELVAIDEATGSRIIEMAGEYVFDISLNPQRNYRLRSIKQV